MKTTLLLLLLPVVGLAGDAQKHELHWMIGCWATPDKRAQEVWVLGNDDSLNGFNVVLKDNAVVFYEVLRIARDSNGVWIYEAYPLGQAATSFKATKLNGDHAVFTNPDHDYPQEIRYQRDDQSLNAQISLLDGINPMPFNKVSCGQGSG